MPVDAPPSANKSTKPSALALIAALGSISQGVIITDTEHNILSANLAFQTITGYAEEEILGKNCRFLQGPLSDPQTIERIHLALQTQTEFSGEILNYRKDGSIFFNALIITPVRDEQGNLTHFIGITRDVTEKHHSQEALSNMAELLERTSEMAHVGGWEIDLRNKTLFWSRETCRIHDIDPPIPPALEDGLNLFPAAARSTIEAAIDKAISDGTPYDLELPKLTVTGRSIWVRLQGAAIQENGQTIKLRGTIHDITVRKLLEIEKENERQILEAVSKGVGLSELLTQLVLNYEKLIPKIRCSILLLDPDGQHLRHSAAPHLPSDFCDAIDGITIGPCAGSCGTAAFLGKPVLVEDIANDPLCENYKELALQHDLQACWSIPIMDEGNRVLGTFAFYSDQARAPLERELASIKRGAHLASLILARHLAQHALIASEIRYRNLVEWMPEAILVHRDGVIIYCNPAAAKLFAAKTHEELLGKSVLDLIHPEFHPQAQIRARVASHPQSLQLHSIEYKLVKLDGTLLYAEVQTAPIDFDNTPAFHTFIHDITARKTAEAEIVATKNKLEAVIEAVPIPLFVKDEQSRFLLMNKACEKQLGVTIAEVYGTDGSRFFPQEQMAHFLEIDRQTFSSGRAVDLEESVWSVAYQQTRTTHTFKNPVFDSAGKPLYMICAMLDITERKQMELTLRETQMRFQAVLDHSPALISIKDLQGNILLANRNFAMLDAPPIQELIGQNIFDVFPQEIAENLWANDQAALIKRGLIESEETVFHKDGQLHTYLSLKFPVKDAYDQIFGTCSISTDITSRKQAEKQLRESEERYRQIVNTAIEGIWMVDHAANTTFVNPKMAEMLGYSPEEMLGRNLSSFMDTTGQSIPFGSKETGKEILAAGHEFKFLRKDGSALWCFLASNALYDANQQYTGTLAMVTDITARRQVEQDLANTAELLERTGEIAKIGGWQYLLSTKKFKWTQEAFRITEIDSTQEPTMEETLQLFPPEARPIISSAIQEAKRNGTAFDLELPFITAKGQNLWVRTQGSAIRDNGKIVQLLGTFQDITQHRKDLEEIRRLGFYDPLTNLPNRRLLLDRLQHARRTSNRTGKHGALMFLDLDHFKQLNDTLGHDVGDILLQQVAARLQSCVREGDSVARLGGDEFVVLLEGFSIHDFEAAAQTETIAQKILEALGKTYHLGEHTYNSTPSIGIVVFAGEDILIEDLLKKADLAMYQAKSAGRNTIRFFDPGMQAAVTARAEMETNLRTALATQEFTLHYQLQVDREGKTTGVEALIRWHHHSLGQVPPAVFVPMAEETGMILSLGQWVLETACQQLIEWSKSPETSHWTMAVNVSASQFSHPDFVINVENALLKTGANPHLLKLELTESMLVKDIDNIIVKMNTIKALGVSFSLDDFGTGYSSLTYLKHLPLDQLKIDQTFVRDVFTDPSDAVIVRTILALGHNLGLKVIAEGVETADQYHFLASIGCDAYQGYYFGSPCVAHALQPAKDK